MFTALQKISCFAGKGYCAVLECQVANAAEGVGGDSRQSGGRVQSFNFRSYQHYSSGMWARLERSLAQHQILSDIPVLGCNVFQGFKKCGLILATLLPAHLHFSPAHALQSGAWPDSEAPEHALHGLASTPS